jgi:hypothetical protein
MVNNLVEHDEFCFESTLVANANKGLGFLKRNLYLMKFMLTVWGGNQQETEFTCVTKRTRYVLVSIHIYILSTFHLCI